MIVHEDGEVELQTTTCSISTGEVQQVVLYHLNGRLVRLVAQLREAPSAAMMKRLQERFGPKYWEAAKETIQGFENAIAGRDASLQNLLENPFGYTRNCDNCKLTLFLHNDADGVVALNQTSSIRAVTLYSTSLTSAEVEKVAKKSSDAKSEVARNRAF